MSNHNYNTPDPGTTDWHSPLNENFEQLDKDVEIRDQLENIKEYIPQEGTKFLASNTGDVYIGDGSDWSYLGSLKDDSISDLHFVAPEQGMAGIQTVINDHAPYVTIQLGNGTYTGNGIILDHGVVIQGNGVRQTELVLNDNVEKDVIGFEDANETNVREVRLQDFSIEGNKNNNSEGWGIYGPFWDARFNRIQVGGCASGGIWMAGSDSESTDDNIIMNSRVFYCDGTGIHFGFNKEAWPAAGAARIISTFIGDNLGHGLFCRGNEYSVYGNQIYWNDGAQIRMEQCSYSTIVGNSLDAGGPHEVTDEIIGLAIESSGGNPIHGITVVGNVFFSYSVGDVYLYANAANGDFFGLNVTGNTIAPSQSVDTGVLFEGTDNFVECQLSNNTFTGDFLTADIDVPDTVIINGEVVESAMGSEPQEEYPPGTLVRFTDTGNNNGTGTYFVTRDRAFIKLSDLV